MPIRVQLPPSKLANESGISSTRADSRERAAQVSTMLIRMATMGVLLRMDDMNATGTHRRTIASACERGLPSIGPTSFSTARVSSSALART